MNQGCNSIRGALVLLSVQAIPGLRYGNIERRNSELNRLQMKQRTRRVASLADLLQLHWLE